MPMVYRTSGRELARREMDQKARAKGPRPVSMVGADRSGSLIAFASASVGYGVER